MRAYRFLPLVGVGLAVAIWQPDVGSAAVSNSDAEAPPRAFQVVPLEHPAPKTKRSGTVKLQSFVVVQHARVRDDLWNAVLKGAGIFMFGFAGLVFAIRRLYRKRQGNSAT